MSSSTSRLVPRERTDSQSFASTNHFYSKDRIHLVRIGIVSIMALVTLLVITLLLQEAIAGDQRIVNSPTRHKLIDKHKVEKAVRGMAQFHGGEIATVDTLTSSTPEELPAPIPEPEMMRDPEYFKKWRDGYYGKRKKSYKRNGDDVPFRLNVLPKDSYDPYMFGEDEHKAKKQERKYSYPPDAKSIQDIIHFLTEGKRSRLHSHAGLRFKGRVKNLDMKDPMSVFQHESRHEPKFVSNNPLVDFRMAGDPKEVNKALMGFDKSTSPKTEENLKPKTVSLMLDIHPMGHDDEASGLTKRERSRRPPSQPPPPKRRQRARPRPQKHYRGGDGGSSSRDEILHGRPSHHNEVYRPSYKGDHDRFGPEVAKHHQITLHLNFFPTAKKQSNAADIDLNPGKSSALSDLAPSPRDEGPPNHKGDTTFKAEPIPNLLNDPSIHVFNRHRYGSATASQSLPWQDPAFDQVSNHRLDGNGVELVGAERRHAVVDDTQHPLLPHGPPEHRFISNKLLLQPDHPEHRHGELKL
ncbi:Hypothetical predicted protein [Cloeon dipterum]|uniref:Uncharacterized protein n=3 Tax=Cloeon dipterum TaxID=197152 RepID=A0A8S1CRM0_9INSE|nr:Hypothetical predicted protein [Cloeon dipterum]